MTKDSFILYTEQKEVIDKLTDEQAGKLIKAIYEYVNTGNMPSIDPILDVIIIPFKQNIDRNIERWEEIKQARREAGRLGGKETQARFKQKQANQANATFAQAKSSKSSKRVANQAVNVNVNDNVNVNVNDNVNVNNNNSLDKTNIANNNISKKENKKENEKIHFAEFVTMTNAEYDNLVSTHSKEFADQCIKVLDNYKGSNGKKYKSDYRAILSWVVGKVQEDNAKSTPKKGNFPQRTYSAEDLSYLYANGGG